MRASVPPAERRLRELEHEYNQLAFDYESLTSEQGGLKRRVAYFRDQLALSTNAPANYELEERIRRDEERLSEIEERLQTLRLRQDTLTEEIEGLNKELADSQTDSQTELEESATAVDLSPADLAELRDKMNDYFSLSELQTLCFELGIDYENIRGGTKATFTRELIQYLARRNRLRELRQALQIARPSVNWY